MKIIKEATEKEFKTYKDFLKYIKAHNLSLKDKGPFDVEDIVYQTVIDVLEAFEE